ncbi:MAG: glycosyltransferase family 2 protein [Oscillospiraceae bacterium]|nr:glycosyltransferase family 2 protein [Oscillospiraceae bacterium]
MSKSKKKAKKKNTGAHQASVRLSQCMIVKNEEKNIETALKWAKDIACEQIVVDTGSTDRTVELAEKMGAKVYHFEWINDFSAAKNFAMDKAKGNWIAILDADEYMPEEDAKELMKLLKNIQGNRQHLKEYDSISCSWVHLDDAGKAFSVITQQRVFQNHPDLRYEGTIHETIMLKNKHYNAENLRIMHTGYAQTVYNAAGKRERNIKLLELELERDPTNPNTMLYLADSIKAAGTEEARAEAESLYLQALESKLPAKPEIKRLAYDFLVSRFSKDSEKTTEAIELCTKALTELPENIDYHYYRAYSNNKLGNFNKALEDLQKCEQLFISAASVPETRVLMPYPTLLYYQLSAAAKGLNDEQSSINYKAILNTMLNEGKDQSKVLGPYLVALFQEGKTGTEVFEALSDVYDINNPHDLMLIARAAKDYGAISFAQKIMEMIGEKLEQQ